MASVEQRWRTPHACAGPGTMLLHARIALPSQYSSPCGCATHAAAIATHVPSVMPVAVSQRSSSAHGAAATHSPLVHTSGLARSFASHVRVPSCMHELPVFALDTPPAAADIAPPPS